MSRVRVVVQLFKGICSIRISLYSYLDTMFVLLYMRSTQTISVVLMVKVLKFDRQIFCMCTCVFKTILITRLHQLFFPIWGLQHLIYDHMLYKYMPKMIIFISFPTDSLKIDMRHIFSGFPDTTKFQLRKLSFKL